MSEPIDVAIAMALRDRLQTPDIQAPATTPIAWPLVDFTPTAGVKYLDVRPIMPAEPEHFGISLDNVDTLRGIFQVDAVVPDDGTGQYPGMRFAGLVAARFPIGRYLTANGRALIIEQKPHIADPVRDAPWLRFPVSIRYRLYTT